MSSVTALHAELLAIITAVALPKMRGVQQPARQCTRALSCTVTAFSAVCIECAHQSWHAGGGWRKLGRKHCHRVHALGRSPKLFIGRMHRYAAVCVRHRPGTAGSFRLLMLHVVSCVTMC
jgi:hypothetical protein